MRHDPLEDRNQTDPGMDRRRLGRFYLERMLVESGMSGAVLEKMGFSPWEVRFIPWMDAYEHIGLSPEFDRLNEAESLPNYIVAHNIRDYSDDDAVALDYEVKVSRIY